MTRGIADELRLSELEVAGGLALGLAPAPSVGGAPSSSPAEALESAILPALRCHPCLVSFSGGVDSSLVLAGAIRLARRLGLDEPVPVTWRFKGAPRADERRWQERTIAALGVSDWERIEVDDELDLIGPCSQAVLRRHGLLYPPNAYLHAPLLARARGGALLTGLGGDQVLGLGRWRHAARVIVENGRPSIRDVAHVGLAISPARLRVALDPRRVRLRSPWLRPAVEHQVAVQYAAWRAREPVRWGARVVWQRRRRDVALRIASLELLAADAGTRIVHPLVDPGYLDALARAAPRRGFHDRRAAIAALLGDVVPRTVLERTGKATFDEAFWRTESRALAREWEGEGVDPALVDVDALRSIWRSDAPPFRTALLLQQAWLSTIKR